MKKATVLLMLMALAAFCLTGLSATPSMDGVADQAKSSIELPTPQDFKIHVHDSNCTHQHQARYDQAVTGNSVLLGVLMMSIYDVPAQTVSLCIGIKPCVDRHGTTRTSHPPGG